MNHLPISAESAWPVVAGAATILVLHIAGGLVGIVSGAVAMAYRKGGARHALAGKVFVDHLSPLKRARLSSKLRKKQRLAG